MTGKSASGWRLSLMVLAGVGLLIAVCLSPFGERHWDGIATLWQGAFGSWRKLSETWVKTCPLLFTGLAVTLAFRTGAFNIGAEGQFILGGIGAVAVGSHMSGAPAWLAAGQVTRRDR